MRPSNIENLAFWSALNKKPAQMHRTKARGEEYLGGTWLVRLHELVELDTFSKTHVGRHLADACPNL